MTTPNQTAPDGSFQISDPQHYGQDVSKEGVQAMYIPSLSVGMDPFTFFYNQLLKLPLEALQLFEPMVPDAVEGVFATVAGAAQAVANAFSFIPLGLAYFEQWLSDTFNTIASEVQQVLEILGGLIVTPINAAVQAVKDWWTLVIGSSVGWVTAWFNAMTGQSQAQATVASAAEQAAALADNQVAQAAAMAAVRAQSTGGGNSGVVGGDDFERESPVDLGSGWTITRTGGAHTLAIADGHNAAMVQSGTTLTDIRAIRADPADAHTLTSYQEITWVEGASVIVSPFGGGTDAQNSMYGRVGPSAYVRVKLDAIGAQWVARLLYVNGGAETALPIGPSGEPYVVLPPRAAATTWIFQCGSTTDLRNFRLVRNGAIVFNFTDTAHVTAEGPTFLGWGFGLGGGVYTPSNVTRVTVADNTPTETASGFLRVSRINASTFVTMPAQVVGPLPGSFFDTVDQQPPDIAWDSATNTATVLTKGAYLVRLSIYTGFWGANQIGGFGVLRNGVIADWMQTSGRRWFITTSGSAALSADDVTMGNGYVYCEAGQTISPAWESNTTKNILGSTDGLKTHMEIVRISP